MKVIGLFHPKETEDETAKPITQSDLHASSIVPSERCPNCRTGSLFKLPPVSVGWLWCSYCGSLCSMLPSRGFIAPDMAESPGN